MKTKSIITISALALATLPLLSFAQTVPLENLSTQDVVNILNNLAGFLYTIFLVIAVIAIIYAAFMYVFSGGNTENVKKANRALIYAAIGIAIAMLSTGIIKLVQAFLQP